MAGLTRRYCRTSCACDPECEGVCSNLSDDCKPYKMDADIKGLCGNCSGKCQPCESEIGEEGVDCGKWQECDCVLDGCGDGHDCHRYIDIEFTLEAFVIQGKICCNANGVPMVQQCGGAYVDEKPHIGTPSGWGATADGITDYVIYEETTHRLRLTRQDCGCFWGGYWSSSCDCNTCCCSNLGDPTGNCTSEDIYPDCGDCYVDNTFAIGDCISEWSQPCDPSNPCHVIDNGYASSLDHWGTESLGTSDAPGICTAQSGLSGDQCEYRSDDCDGWINLLEKPAHACWNCGLFKPHHIEAYFTYAHESEATEACNTGWVLEIRGLTESTRSEYGLANSYPSHDCSGTSTCHKSSGGTDEAGLGYRGRWWGVSSICNLSHHCEDMSNIPPNIICGTEEGYPSQGDCPPISELVFHGCGCPPSFDLESTVRVDGAQAAFHPTGVYGSASGGLGGGHMHTCVVSDAQGSQPSETYCNDALGIGSQVAHVCTGSTFTGVVGGENVYTEGTCYGPPMLWWDYCDHCESPCFGDWGACDGSDCDADPPVGPCCGDSCNCNPPQDTTVHGDIGVGIPNENYPCSHCISGEDEHNLNHESCNPCPTSGDSRQCAGCSIMVRPNSNPSPWWAGAS